MKLFNKKKKEKQLTVEELEYKSYGVTDSVGLYIAKHDEGIKRLRELNPDLDDLEIEGNYHYLHYKVEQNFVQIRKYTPYELQFFTNKGYKILVIDKEKVIFRKEDK